MKEENLMVMLSRNQKQVDRKKDVGKYWVRKEAPSGRKEAFFMVVLFCLSKKGNIKKILGQQIFCPRTRYFM